MPLLDAHREVTGKSVAHWWAPAGAHGRCCAGTPPASPLPCRACGPV